MRTAELRGRLTPAWIALAIVGTGLIPLLIVGLIGYRTAARSLRSDTEARLHAAAASTSLQLDRLLFERQGDVESFSKAHSAQVLDAPAVQRLTGILLRAYRPIYAVALVSDARGRIVVARSLSHPGVAAQLVGVDESAATWFRAALQKPVAVTAGPSPGRLAALDGGYGVTFSAPIRRSGRTVGVWANVLSWGVVERVLRDTVSEVRTPGLHAFLADGRGRTLASDLPLASVAHSIHVGRSGTVPASSFIPSSHASDVVAAMRDPGYSTFPGMGWELYVVQNRASALAVANRLRRTMWLLGVLAAALVAAAAIVVAVIFRRSESAVRRLAAELAASRARIVAAADESRRRVERDLHDGAQQRLVSLLLQLRTAAEQVPAELGELPAALEQAIRDGAGALEEVRRVSHGLHPAVLSRHGLDPALRALARRSPIEVDLEVATSGRLPGPIETTAYYVASEALANATKHARASCVRIAASERDGALRLVVRDDGIGGADATRGSGLIGLRDRVEAVGGTMDVASPPGSGTTVTVDLPLRPRS